MPTTYALLLIDCQNDFCHSDGALYVPGAEDDMKRLGNFIRSNGEKLGQVFYTMDDHPVNDISHPAYWEDAQGSHPDPLTQITLNEVKEGKWVPRFNAKEVKTYLEKLESEGQYPHLIWPFHCISGSWGQAIYQPLFKTLKQWALKGREPHPVRKGRYPLSEHFGVFQAQVPKAEAPETQLNQALVDALNQHDKILVGGEAKSHCVANSLRQAIDLLPDLAKKMIILEDCMSDVPDMGHLGEPVYRDARNMGLEFAKSEEFQF